MDGKNIKFQQRTTRKCHVFVSGKCKFGNCCNYLLGETLPSITETNLQTSPSLSDEQHTGDSASESLLSTGAKHPLEKFSPTTSSPTGATTNSIKKVQSIEKTCGICFEIVGHQAERNNKIFGILPNCNHCFCYSCIEKWRNSEDFDESGVSQACPQCRIPSEFVYSSKRWIEDTEEKQLLINYEKIKMKNVRCPYFKSGRCPFNDTCFYLHHLSNGPKLNIDMIDLTDQFFDSYSKFVKSLENELSLFKSE